MAFNKFFGRFNKNENEEEDTFDEAQYLFLQ